VRGYSFHPLFTRTDKVFTCFSPAQISFSPDLSPAWISFSPVFQPHGSNCHPFFACADKVFRHIVFRIFGIFVFYLTVTNLHPFFTRTDKVFTRFFTRADKRFTRFSPARTSFHPRGQVFTRADKFSPARTRISGAGRGGGGRGS
jgi:hypothetical protein